MKWGEFKKLLEEAGVRDEDQVVWIQVQNYKPTLTIEKIDIGWTVDGY